MSVVPIRPAVGAEDIAATLRRIADQYEAGEYGLATTCLVVMGHTSDRPENGGVAQSNTFEMFGLGPRTDIFTVRGLLLTVATRL